MKKLLMALMALALMVVLAACGSNDDKAADNNAAGDNGDTEKETEDVVEETTMTVKHQLGETTLEKNPETVVVFDFGTLDTLDELGVEVAGLPQKNVPGYLSKFEDAKYKDLGSLKEPDFEAIHALNPDVIFISARQSDMYDELSEIAPTIFVGVNTEHYMESFKQNMEMLAELFGKEEEMKEELASIDEQVAAIKEKTANHEEKTLIVLGTEGKVSAYGPNSRFGLIHDVFGFKPADEKIEVSTHGQSVSFEYILETNPDILFVVDRDAAIGGGASVKESVENDLVQKTNAFQNDKIVYLNADYWYLSGGGLASLKEMIKEVEAGL